MQTVTGPRDIASAPDHPYPVHRRYLLVLGVLFAILWTALAIDPWYRGDWALENALVAAFVVFVALTYKRLILSRVSYTLIFLFLCLHEIGAHYTYAEVPYDQWFRAFTGVTLNSLLDWERNNLR
jgi:putative membrane protein